MRKYIHRAVCILKELVAMIFVGISFTMCSPKINNETGMKETNATVSVEHLDSVKKDNQSTITDNTIQILTENGNTLRSGIDERYLFFKNNGRIIKRKVERYERINLSPSEDLVAVFKSSYNEAIRELTLFTLNGDSTVIKTDTIFGRFFLADDGRFALVKNPYYSDEASDYKVYLYDNNGIFKYEHPQIFYYSFEAAFSKDGLFAVFGYTSSGSYNTAELKIFDQKFNQTDDYILNNYGNKNFIPLRFDNQNNVILRTYKLTEGVTPEKNSLDKYRLIFSPDGKLSKKLEGWGDE
jgi:hypothetical protein